MYYICTIITKQLENMTNSQLHNKINLRARMIESEYTRQLKENGYIARENTGIFVSILLKNV